MTTLNDAFKFMLQTDRPHYHQETRDNILSLVKQIDTIYKTHIRKSCNKLCDICGKGDWTRERIVKGKTIIDSYRVKDLIDGYEHREKESPVLCFGHDIGWGRSFESRMYDSIYEKCPIEEQWKIPRFAYAKELVSNYGLSDEEIDLHFAMYLAKQLTKYCQTVSKKGEDDVKDK